MDKQSPKSLRSTRQKVDNKENESSEYAGTIQSRAEIDSQ